MKQLTYRQSSLILWANLLAIILLLVSSCATKEERARRMVERANRLFPIVQMKDTILLTDTVLVIDTFVVTKRDTVRFKVKVEVPVNGKFKSFKNKTLIDNADAVVTGSMDSLGNMNFNVEVKEKKIPVHIEYVYRDTALAKTKYIVTPPEKIMVRGFIYWLGIMAGLAILVFFGLKAYRYYKKVTTP